MMANILPGAEEDIETAFRYYEAEHRGLGVELLDEFRSGIEQILRFPQAWHPMDETYRRYRQHRFPYGIVYRTIENSGGFLVVAVMHLSRKPGSWYQRDR
ncbi:MAG: type II toxin-antitoxin system RelE/ParE family toxin [Tepidisphaeraceae bacterium]